MYIWVAFLKLLRKYYNLLKNMEKIDWSKRVMDIFLDICKIPRPSGREEKMGVFLMGFAAARGLAAKKDEVGNVLISKPAPDMRTARQ